MTEEEKQEMIETVLERTGIQLDTPENQTMWDVIEQHDELFEKLFEALILNTAKYLEPINEA